MLSGPRYSHIQPHSLSTAVPYKQANSTGSAESDRVSQDSGSRIQLKILKPLTVTVGGVGGQIDRIRTEIG